MRWLCLLAKDFKYKIGVMKIISVVGARPNFVKIAPFMEAINKYNEVNNEIISHILVHTGQHYDVRMSELFFNELNIPAPDINLEIGSGSHSEQIGGTMIAFERVLLKEAPDWVVVVGDVNATLACTVAAKKLNIKVCHIEAGLRSGDMSMPEEINRLVTDRLADLLLTPDKMSTKNLINEGVNPSRIKFVGNIMIDTLEKQREKASHISISEIIDKNRKSSHSVGADSVVEYAVATIHRPSNVDYIESLSEIAGFLISAMNNGLKLIWPIHPRTEKQLKKFNMWDAIASHDSIFLLEPIGYTEMLRLNMKAKVVLTDSGGLQEECTVLGTPCLTMRWNTERPVTLREHGGVSVLVGNDMKRIKKEFYKAILEPRKSVIPELWDGRTSERCLEAIIDYVG